MTCTLRDKHSNDSAVCKGNGTAKAAMGVRCRGKIHSSPDSPEDYSCV